MKKIKELKSTLHYASKHRGLGYAKVTAIKKNVGATMYIMKAYNCMHVHSTCWIDSWWFQNKIIGFGGLGNYLWDGLVFGLKQRVVVGSQ